MNSLPTADAITRTTLLYCASTFHTDSVESWPFVVLIGPLRPSAPATMRDITRMDQHALQSEVATDNVFHDVRSCRRNIA
jgi:hypothetical protein